jgi:hypothetical protein
MTGAVYATRQRRTAGSSHVPARPKPSCACRGAEFLGECDECRRRRLGANGGDQAQALPASVPFIAFGSVSDFARVPIFSTSESSLGRLHQGTPSTSPTSSAKRDRHDRDRLVNIKMAPAESPRLVSPGTQPAIRASCDRRCTSLLPGSFGETECDVDPKTREVTGDVLTTVTDTDPCSRPCTEMHEAVHALHMRPVCRELRGCITSAGADADAYSKCYEAFDLRVAAMSPGTECVAYRTEAECLRLRQEEAGCNSPEARSRLAKRLQGVQCYRDCFCASLTAGGTKRSR